MMDHYSLQDIKKLINKITNGLEDFGILEKDKQIQVLNYIKDNNLDIKILKRKGYDILSNSFFVEEYVLDDDCPLIFPKRREFNSFTVFMYYVKDDIYDNTCFYGYTFSEDDIKKYSINIKRINFDSFIDYTLDGCSYEKRLKTLETKKKNNYEETRKVIKWIQKEPLSTSEKLSKKFKYFKSYYSYLSNAFFWQYGIEKNKQAIQQPLIQLFCECGDECGLSFIDILIYFGKDVANKVIENYVGKYSEKTRKNHIRNFKREIELYYDDSNFKARKRGYYEERIGFYRIDYLFYYGEAYAWMNHSEYFINFNDFAKELNNDLSDCDLSNAPITIDNLSKYKTNEKTILPNEKNYTLIMNKGYKDHSFYVDQKWINMNNKELYSNYNHFEYFCDYVHFLKGDISNSNFIMCEGIENISKLNNLNITGIKVTSDIAKELNLSLNELPKYQLNEFDFSIENEIATQDNYLDKRIKDDEDNYQVGYISDIHLTSRYFVNNCITMEDAEKVNRSIVHKIAYDFSSIKLIAGDIASDFDVYTNFINAFYEEYSHYGKIFLTLGNHELWPFEGKTLEEIVANYKNLIEKNEKMYLVHNNIYYFDTEYKEITEKQLATVSAKELREKLRAASIVIFGGIGFAGRNDKFNADLGIYNNIINRKQEIEQTDIFYSLYKKVAEALYDKNVIILTHMPFIDWSKDTEYVKGFVYVNGHNHHNYFYDDGIKRIYADNQIGYRQKEVEMKDFSISFDYDWFSDYEDGIYKITREDYWKFYRGINERISFSREFKELYMVKHDEAYMFLMENTKGVLQILNGGGIRNAENYDINYYFENLSLYSKSIKLFLTEYSDFQQGISDYIRQIGGTGRIHGCIVDIDYYNHLYLNPLDGKISVYYADSITEKYFYNNLASLLKYECPSIYIKYQEKENQQLMPMILGSNLTISDKKTFVSSTEMYKISRIIKSLQFTTNHNVIRLWSDSIVKEPSKESGKLIVGEIINPEKQ